MRAFTDTKSIAGERERERERCPSLEDTVNAEAAQTVKQGSADQI